MAAFYFDEREPREVLRALTQQLVRSGCAPGGAVHVLRGAAPPAFECLSDLAGRGEVLALPPRREAVELERLFADPAVHVLRAALTAREAGLIVGFTPSAAATEPHLVAATLSGSRLCVPAGVSRSRAERSQAQRLATWLQRLFLDACAALKPLYAALSVEAYLPSPHQMQRGDARLSTEIFLSAPLLLADAMLARDIQAI